MPEKFSYKTVVMSWGMVELRPTNTMKVALGVRKGAWTDEEDALLRNCVDRHGEGKWHLVPSRAGTNIPCMSLSSLRLASPSAYSTRVCVFLGRVEQV